MLWSSFHIRPHCPCYLSDQPIHPKVVKLSVSVFIFVSILFQVVQRLWGTSSLPRHPVRCTHACPWPTTSNGRLLHVSCCVQRNDCQSKLRRLGSMVSTSCLHNLYIEPSNPVLAFFVVPFAQDRCLITSKMYHFTWRFDTIPDILASHVPEDAKQEVLSSSPFCSLHDYWQFSASFFLKYFKRLCPVFYCIERELWEVGFVLFVE